MLSLLSGDDVIPLLNLPGVLREPAAAHHLLLLQVTLPVRALDHGKMHFKL